MHPTVYLFDIDGTLLSSGGAGTRAFNRALHAVGLTAAAGFNFAGMTDRAIARRCLIEGGRRGATEEIDALLETYLNLLDEELPPNTPAPVSGYRVLPNVEAVVQAVSALPRVAVGLGTGNLARGAEKKLRPAGLWQRFGFGGFGCDAEHRGQMLEIGAKRGAKQLGCGVYDCRLVVIGDTPKDVEAAEFIGAESLGVCTGSFDNAALVAAGATLVVEDLSDQKALPWLRG